MTLKEFLDAYKIKYKQEYNSITKDTWILFNMREIDDEIESNHDSANIFSYLMDYGRIVDKDTSNKDDFYVQFSKFIFRYDTLLKKLYG